MTKMCLFVPMLFFAATSANAECWVVENLSGVGSKQFNQYEFQKDGYSGKVFVLNFDRKSPSVTDSIMDYTLIGPTSMVGTYHTDLGVTIQTWQISTDGKKAFMTINRTNTNSAMQDAVASFVGDVQRKCEK